jgi:hypothetical protein
MRLVTRTTIYDATAAPPQARFATFPVLERQPDGRLLAAFRVGSSKDAPDEDVRVMASDDEGQTWQMICGGFGDVLPGGWRARALGVTALPDGGLIGALTAIDRSDPTRPLADPVTQGILPATILVADSPDGATWSVPHVVPTAPYAGCVTTGAVLVLHDGTLALPYESWKDWGDTSYGEHRAALRFSSDAGRTWPQMAVVAHDPSGRLLFWDQRVAVDPATGRMVALLWSHDRQAACDAPIHVAWGDATGQNWSAPTATPIDGQIASPLFLPGGRLLATYVHRHDPPGLRAVLSDDGGLTWQMDAELEFYAKRRAGSESGMGGTRDFGDYWADMSVWFFGHPAPVLLPGGDVLVAYYAGDGDSMGVEVVRITL